MQGFVAQVGRDNDIATIRDDDGRDWFARAADFVGEPLTGRVLMQECEFAGFESEGGPRARRVKIVRY